MLDGVMRSLYQGGSIRVDEQGLFNGATERKVRHKYLPINLKGKPQWSSYTYMSSRDFIKFMRKKGEEITVMDTIVSNREK